MEQFCASVVVHLNCQANRSMLDMLVLRVQLKHSVDLSRFDNMLLIHKKIRMV